MQPGSVAHLFYEQRILLVKRAPSEYVDPGKWDSVSETIEAGESFTQAMRRGLMEEIGVVPNNLYLLGTTRAGHGFHCGSLNKEEFRKVRPDGKEIERVELYDLAEIRGLELGGSLRNHFAAYPEAFCRLARGFAVWRQDFGLAEIVPEKAKQAVLV